MFYGRLGAPAWVLGALGSDWGLPESTGRWMLVGN